MKCNRPLILHALGNVLFISFSIKEHFSFHKEIDSLAKNSAILSFVGIQVQ